MGYFLLALANNAKINAIMTNLYQDLETAVVGTQIPVADALATLQWNDDGLLPAVAQQYDSGRILMLAWMNAESLRETLATGRVCYWSRSRQQLWRKGETSGNIQTLMELRIDCDGDTLLLAVDQHGPACHTQCRSCFYWQIEGEQAEHMLKIDGPS